MVKDILVVLAIFNALKTISRNTSSEKVGVIKDFGDYVFENSINKFTHKFDIEMIKRAQEEI